VALNGKDKCEESTEKPTEQVSESGGDHENYINGDTCSGTLHFSSGPPNYLPSPIYSI